MNNRTFGYNFRVQMPIIENDPISNVTRALLKEGVAVAVEWEDVCISLIVEEARKQGITDLTVLNEKYIIEAFHKQIPKKPDYIQLSDRPVYRCPCCGIGVYKHTKYCCDCGQALDWSYQE